MRPIRVLVVDYSMMFRNMLVKGLDSDPNIEVVAQAQAYAAISVASGNDKCIER